MKQLLLVILCLPLSLATMAQTKTSAANDTLPYPAILREMENARVVQDQTVTRLVQEKIAGVEHGVKEISGFRVQIYSSNQPGVAKTEAVKLKERIESSSNIAVYVISAPPFIKVRVGDFRTQQEAADYKTEFVQQYPDLVGDTYVVRDDHIKVIK